MALMVLVYTLFRPAPPEQIFTSSDKAGHFIAFFGVSLLGRLSLGTISNRMYWSVCLSLAGLLEYLQGEFRPLRLFSFEDAYANAIGVVFAFGAYYAIKKAFRSSS